MNTPTDFPILSREFRRAREIGEIESFVRRSAIRPEFARWLNSESIRGDEFFASASTAKGLSMELTLSPDRRAALKWYEVADRISSSGEPGLMDALVTRVSAAAPPAVSGEVRRFVLAQTHPSEFFGRAHELLFLEAFSDAIKKGQHDRVRDTLSEEPKWISDYVTLSALARLSGPQLVGFVAEACHRTRNPDIQRAFQMLTGVSPADLPDMVRWFRDVEPRLVINPYGLYPAPTIGPMFVLATVPK